MSCHVTGDHTHTENDVSISASQLTSLAEVVFLVIMAGMKSL